MSDTIRNTLHAILDGPYADNSTFEGANRTSDKQNFDKMKAIYNTCMNEDAIKEYGVEPVAKILEEFETIYPAKGENPTAANRAELTKALVWLAKNSVEGLISAGSGVSA